MAALDAEIAGFLEAHARGAKTVRNDAANWRIWERHCRSFSDERGVDVDPFDAPFEVFREFPLASRKDGGRYTAGTVTQVIATVVWFWGEERVPPHRHPEHAVEWEQLMRGLRREEAARKATGEQVGRDRATPLLRDDAVRMLAAEPPRTAYLDAWRAAVLLALDSQLGPAAMLAIMPGDVELLGDPDPRTRGPIQLRAREGVFGLPCQHTDYVRGVPFDCTACAVRAVLAAHPGDGPLLMAAPVGLRQQIGKMRGQWPGLKSATPYQPVRLVEVPGLSRWERAGLRRALVLSLGVDRGFRWVRARAWTAVSWVAGFRMGGDLAKLERSAVTPDPAGRGYRLRLDATKDDAYGDKDVARPFGWSATGGPSAAQALTEYLAVRDAAVGGRHGQLLLEAEKPHAPLDPTVADQPATADLQLLCEFAGLPPIYTSYSTRRGYAHQAELDGWPVEDISRGLRHQELDTTTGHYTGALSAQQVATKLMRA